ncbi:cobalamin biosynthesis protein [Streptomyces thermolilacinus]|uniref:cobalamin biosynthesis protein n=1 Tax=Streptomyces thermolilacinus TaxID=285540 RepID=UPI003F4D6E33
MSLVVGVGARRGVSAREVCDLVAKVLREAGRGPEEVVALATVAAKAGEPGLVEAAARLGVPLRAHPADVLARVRVPHPSGAVLAAAGTASVAEAAALVEAAALASAAHAGGASAAGAQEAVVAAEAVEAGVPAEAGAPAEGLVAAEAGVPSDAGGPSEAVALADGGALGARPGLTGSELLVPKRKSASGAARVTCAVAVAYGDGRLPSEAPGYHRGDAVFDLRAPCRTADPRAGYPVRPPNATRWAADAVGPP